MTLGINTVGGISRQELLTFRLTVTANETIGFRALSAAIYIGGKFSDRLSTRGLFHSLEVNGCILLNTDSTPSNDFFNVRFPSLTLVLELYAPISARLSCVCLSLAVRFCATVSLLPGSTTPHESKRLVGDAGISAVGNNKKNKSARSSKMTAASTITGPPCLVLCTGMTCRCDGTAGCGRYGGLDPLGT